MDTVSTPLCNGEKENADSKTFRGSHHSMSSYHPQQKKSRVVDEKPSSTRLIRLTLNKPMGIVFESMMDPHNSSQEKGIKISDLQSNGAAALSRKLKVGDELVSVNNKTVSRMTFDEVTNVILDANLANVNLVFRRPRREHLHATPDPRESNSTLRRSSVAMNYQKTKSIEERNGLKWGNYKDGSQQEEKEKVRISPKKKSRSSDKVVTTGDLRPILANMDLQDFSRRSRNDRSHKKNNILHVFLESFCSIIGPGDLLDDDETAIPTYVSHKEKKLKPQKKGKTITKSSERERGKEPIDKPYSNDHDDGTMDFEERKSLSNKATFLSRSSSQENDNEKNSFNYSRVQPSILNIMNEEREELLNVSGNPQDNATLETFETLDQVIDLDQLSLKQDKLPSLPSLRLIIDKFGLDYPTKFNLTREETIRQDPLKFYRYVVKGILQENEPESVSLSPLLNKLLTKYKGREPHLILDLSDRYGCPKDFKFDAHERKEIDPTTKPQYKKVNEDEINHNFGTFPKVTGKNGGNFFENSRPMEGNHNEIKIPSSKDEKNKCDIDASHSSQTECSLLSDPNDGASPEVIAQVSELLDYIYGKTSMPRHIKRVSSVMKAYEGREAKLLKSLKAKALLKAIEYEETANNLPATLCDHLTVYDDNGNSADVPNYPKLIITDNSDDNNVAVCNNRVGRTKVIPG